MNIPFSPLWLWPIVIGLAVVCVRWRRWQKAEWANHRQAGKAGYRTGWKNVRGLPVLVAMGTVFIAYALARYSVPPVHGRLVDAKTGKPIAGATVSRRLFRPGGFQLTEGFSSAGEPFSLRTVTTDVDGRYRLPGWVSLIPVGFSGFSGMGWMVYRPGYMPERGCLTEGFHGGLGCGPFNEFRDPEPWAKLTVDRRIGSVRIDASLFPPITEGIDWPGGPTWTQWESPDRPNVVKHFPEDVDPWGEYFRRLNVLSQYNWLPVEEFVKEAVGYVCQGAVTEQAFGVICRFPNDNYLGSHRNGSPCYRGDAAWTMLEIQEQVCREHPGWCNAAGLAFARRYLEKNCGYLRRKP